MEHTLKIFTSESNIKSEPKREQLAQDNDARPANDEPVLYRLFANFMATNKRVVLAAKKEDRAEKLAEMPRQMKEDESEGEVLVRLCRSKSRSCVTSQRSSGRARSSDSRTGTTSRWTPSSSRNTTTTRKSNDYFALHRIVSSYSPQAIPTRAAWSVPMKSIKYIAGRALL
jgi:hypothetical protein